MSYELAVKLNGEIYLDWCLIDAMSFGNDREIFQSATISFHLNAEWLPWFDSYMSRNNNVQYDFHIRHLDSHLCRCLNGARITSFQISSLSFHSAPDVAEINLIFRSQRNTPLMKKSKSTEKICWKKYGF